MTPSTQDARATGLVEKRDTTDAHYARCGPPHSPCWHCVMPTVCPFKATCPPYAAGVAALAASTKDQRHDA